MARPPMVQLNHNKTAQRMREKADAMEKEGKPAAAEMLRKVADKMENRT